MHHAKSCRFIALNVDHKILEVQMSRVTLQQRCVALRCSVRNGTHFSPKYFYKDMNRVCNSPNYYQLYSAICTILQRWHDMVSYVSSEI